MVMGQRLKNFGGFFCDLSFINQNFLELNICLDIFKVFMSYLKLSVNFSIYLYFFGMFIYIVRILMDFWFKQVKKIKL